MNCSSKTGRFPYAAKPQATPRMVDSARGELKTWFENSVESFCVRRNTPPFGSSMSSPKRIRRGSSSKPARKVLFTVSPIRYFPGGRISLSIFGRFGDVREKLVGRGVLGLFGLAVFATNALLNFVVELRKFFCGNNAFLDQLILPAFKRIEFFELPQFFLPAIEFLIVRTGVTGEPLHLDPEKERPAAGADLVERFGCRVINLLHILSIDLAPVL